MRRLRSAEKKQLARVVCVCVTSMLLMLHSGRSCLVHCREFATPALLPTRLVLSHFSLTLVSLLTVKNLTRIKSTGVRPHSFSSLIFFLKRNATKIQSATAFQNASVCTGSLPAWLFELLCREEMKNELLNQSSEPSLSLTELPTCDACRQRPAQVLW